MQARPSRRSCQRVSPRCVATCTQVSTRPCEDTVSPNRLFSCDVKMVMAAADVNPAITGLEMKAIRNPGGREAGRQPVPSREGSERERGPGLTEIEEAEEQNEDARGEAEDVGDVGIAPRVLVRQDGHDGRRSDGDVLARAEEHVHERPEEGGVEPVLRQTKERYDERLEETAAEARSLPPKEEWAKERGARSPDRELGGRRGGQVLTFGGSPAIRAYAMPCGMTVRPTVSPATTSPARSSAL